MIGRRKLGPLDVSAIALGCMSMTPIYGQPNPDEAIATLHRATDVGIDFIDTSDAYGANGANEELVGRALQGRREKYILATKFGNIRLPDGRPGAKGNPEHVIDACEKSLKRLGTDVIDLYFIHRVDDTVPIEDTVGAMTRLKAQGKIRHLGISEAGASTRSIRWPRCRPSIPYGPATSSRRFFHSPTNSASVSSPTRRWVAAS
jgi:aryl-alcohol dehydrogenase-like predicted oxidoreductase